MFLIPLMPPIFTPLVMSIFNCTSLVQSLLVLDCPFDPFEPLDRSRMNGPSPSFSVPKFYCFATLMFFAGRRPYHLIIALYTCTLHVILLSHPFVTACTFQTPLALKVLFID